MSTQRRRDRWLHANVGNFDVNDHSIQPNRDFRRRTDRILIPREPCRNPTGFYVDKYDPSGAMLWSRDFHAQITGIDTDNDGNVYVCGYEPLCDLITLRSWSASGTLRWTFKHGGDLNDLFVDKENERVYVVGSPSRKVEFPLIATTDGCYARGFDLDGNLLWSRNRTHDDAALGPADDYENETLGGIAVAAFDNVVLTHIRHVADFMGTPIDRPYVIERAGATGNHVANQRFTDADGQLYERHCMAMVSSVSYYVAKRGTVTSLSPDPGFSTEHFGIIGRYHTPAVDDDPQHGVEWYGDPGGTLVSANAFIFRGPSVNDDFVFAGAQRAASATPEGAHSYSINRPLNTASASTTYEWREEEAASSLSNSNVWATAINADHVYSVGRFVRTGGPFHVSKRDIGTGALVWEVAANTYLDCALDGDGNLFAGGVQR